MSQYDNTRAGSAASLTDRDKNVTVMTPNFSLNDRVSLSDRVRWGPILAGLFAALSTMAVLGVLGAAIAGSAYDPGDSARSFGIGAGLWGIITVLASFALGGWVAARSAAVRRQHNGVLNGAMVWAVAIPVMAYLLASGASRLADTAAIAAANSQDNAMQASARMTGDGVSVPGNSGDATQGSARVTADQKERAADAGARTAWSTLVALLLGLTAASFGGYLGGTRDRVGHADDNRSSSHLATAATA